MDISELKEHTRGPCVITLIGASGAGKSSVANLLAVGPDEILSSDHNRFLLSGDASNLHVSGEAFKMLYHMLEVRSGWRQRSIVDSTGLKRRDRSAFYSPTYIKSLSPFAVLVDTPLAVCKSRQFLRDRQVPEDVIERHHAAYLLAREAVMEDVEKWAGVFSYDTITGLVTILR